MNAVKVRGELHCYSCGHVTARFEGEKLESGFKARLIAPLNGPTVRLQPGAAPRCGRCGGQVYVDEVEVINPPRRSEPAANTRPVVLSTSDLAALLAAWRS
jgi:hypothetical protein